MNKCYLLLLVFFSFLSFSQDNVVYDFIHQSQLQYDVVELESNNPDLEILEKIEFVKLHQGTWKGIDKVNALIKEKAETINSKAFATRFAKEYDKALKKTLLEWHASCLKENKGKKGIDCGNYLDYKDNFTPENVFAEFRILSLNDRVLIGGMHLTFTAARESYLNTSYDLGFQDLQYYDLINGVEIDPSTILQKSTKNAFIKLAKSKVPEHLKTIADSLDFNTGFPLFNGGSFYYFVYGNIEADTDDQVVIQLRFSYEEAIPFLNPKGPFNSYIGLKKEPANYNELTYHETRYYDHYFAKEVSNLESIDRLLESLNGKQYAYQKAVINTGSKQAKIQVEFNKNGTLTNHKWVLQEENLADDSLSYIYYPSGTLKEIQLYRIKNFYDSETDDEIEKFSIDELYQFDEKQNLIQKTKFGSINSSDFSNDSEIEYFTYFGNRVIQDFGSVSPCSMGYVFGSYEFQIIEGNLEKVKESGDLSKFDYTIEREKNETRLLYEHKQFGVETCTWRYFTKDGRIDYYFEDNDHAKIILSYDDRGNLISSTKYKVIRDELVLYSLGEIEYTEQNRPQKYTFYVYNPDETVNNSRTYTFKWDTE